jgi:hypothetical protein
MWTTSTLIHGFSLHAAKRASHTSTSRITSNFRVGMGRAVNKRGTIPSRRLYATQDMSSSSSTTSNSCDSSSSFLVRLSIPTSDEMEEVGALLACISQPPDCLLLDGDLGAGKTSFARGFIQCKTSNVEDRVTSPTYLLSNTYLYQPDEIQEAPLSPIEYVLMCIVSCNLRLCCLYNNKVLTLASGEYVSF